MLNFCIIDDNQKIISKLSSMLESIFLEHDFDATVAFTTTVPNELISYVSQNEFDVLLIDIELHSNLNGLDIAKKIRKRNKNCYIIFITAHLEFALIAYKYKTFDYLSKPISKERLEETIIRLFDDVYDNKKNFIKLDNKNTIINENDISYIRRDGMKIIFHTNSRDYEVYSSFNKIQDKLPNNFIRCHKSFIANVNNITKVECSSNIVYFDNCFCDIGPKYKNNFMEVMNHYGNIK